MFSRLRALFGGKLRIGDRVTVLEGPYAGKTGTITAATGHEFSVYIDECCQPTLTDASLRRMRQGRGSTEIGPPDAGVDEE
jgi:ribosomal protein L24